MENLKSYESVRIWLTSLRASGKALPGSKTERLYLYWLGKFCDFTGLNPDQLIREWKRCLRSEDFEESQKPRLMLDEFVVYLQERKGYKRNTVGQAVAAIKSFFARHNLAIKYEFSWEDTAEARLPSPEELASVYEAVEEVCKKHVEEVRAFILIAKDSGLSAKTILELEWDRPQSAGGERPFPSIVEQLEEGKVPIHIRVERGKTKVKHDTFLGEEAIRGLSILYEKTGGHGRIIPLRDDYIRHRLRRASREAGVEPISPQLIRKFFITRMKLAPALVRVDLGEFRIPYDAWAAIVERMAEHSGPKVERAYFKPPPEVLAKLYLAHYDAIRIFKKGDLMSSGG